MHTYVPTHHTHIPHISNTHSHLYMCTYQSYYTPPSTEHSTHIAPSQAPTLLYASDPQPTSVHLHWSYSEAPPTGRLVGFKIKLYHQDPRYPERNTVLVLEEMYDLMLYSTTVTNFSYILMYLSPGVGYNVYMSAHTIAGEGPQARVAFSTLRTGMFCRHYVCLHHQTTACIW